MDSIEPTQSTSTPRALRALQNLQAKGATSLQIVQLVSLLGQSAPELLQGVPEIPGTGNALRVWHKDHVRCFNHGH